MLKEIDVKVHCITVKGKGLRVEHEPLHSVKGRLYDNVGEAEVEEDTGAIDESPEFLQIVDRQKGDVYNIDKFTGKEED
jgi:hypothetical protein